MGEILLVVVPVSWVSVATIMSGEIDSVVSARVLRFLNMDGVLTTSILNVFFIEVYRWANFVQLWVMRCGEGCQVRRRVGQARIKRCIY